MCKIFYFFMCFILIDFCVTIKFDDICSTPQFKRIFLDLGESGVLTARKITINRSNENNLTLHEGCQMEVATCSSCIMSLTFKYMNLNCYCGSGFNLLFHNPCRCDYVWITEPPYEDSSGVSFCRTITGEESNLEYRSKTRLVRISFFYSRPHFHAFTLEYKSEDNRQLFFGTPEYSRGLNLSANFISSPFFPSAYPPDMIAEYIITCLKRSNYSTVGVIDADLDCRVHLTFTDFQLASSSLLEFYDGERRLGIVTGSSFRPPAITTSTNSLKVRFFASGKSNLGFKAVFSFLPDKIVKEMAKPITDCGGYVDNLGGVITMMNMTETEMKLYDCIWLIKPLRELINFKNHLYLKVTAFLDFDGHAELQVRQGLTSESPVLEELRYPKSRGFKEHVLPLKSGYYVSLRAAFGPASYFAITYASFSYNRCFFMSEFLCRNFRCISKELTCDGFDHCGDNSDESPACYREWEKESSIGRWYIRTPNYYFPKVKEYANFRTACLVFLLSLAGLIFFVSALMAITYRTGWKIRRPRNLEDQLHSVSEFLDNLSDEVSMEEIMVDDPPLYEPPPNYEDVVKVHETRRESGDFLSAREEL